MGAIGSTILGVLLQAALTALTNTLTNLFTGVIQSGLASVTKALDSLKGAWSWVGDFVSDIVNNFSLALSRIVQNGLVRVSTAVQKTIGVFGAQERAFTALANWADKQTDSFLRWARLIPEERTRIADTLLTGLKDASVTRTEYIVGDGNNWLDKTYVGMGGWFQRFFDRAQESLSEAANWWHRFWGGTADDVEMTFEEQREYISNLIEDAETTTGSIIGGFSGAITLLLEQGTKIVARMLTINPDEAVAFATATMGQLFEALRTGAQAEEPFGGG